MCSDHPELPGMPKKRAHRNHDYIDLFPGNVFPTGEIDILERGNNLLIIKSYEYAAKIADAHRKIWKLLVKYGNNPDAPGSVTVVCVWGLGDTPREVVVFDPRGESPVRSMTIEGWRQWLDGWWSSSKGHR
jgi:hypothetical protein